MGEAAIPGGEAFAEAKGEVGGDFASDEHLEETESEGRAETDEGERREVLGTAEGGEFDGFDEEGIDVHVFGRVFDAPFDAFDNDEIGEGIAVEGVEEEETIWFEDAAGFRYEAVRFFDMFENIGGAGDVEGTVGVGEGISTGFLVLDRTGNISLLSDEKALL